MNSLRLADCLQIKRCERSTRLRCRTRSFEKVGGVRSERLRCRQANQPGRQNQHESRKSLKEIKVQNPVICLGSSSESKLRRHITKYSGSLKKPLQTK